MWLYCGNWPANGCRVASHASVALTGHAFRSRQLSRSRPAVPTKARLKAVLLVSCCSTVRLYAWFIGVWKFGMTWTTLKGGAGVTLCPYMFTPGAMQMKSAQSEL